LILSSIWVAFQVKYTLVVSCRSDAHVPNLVPFAAYSLPVWVRHDYLG
jgi:hypothetical protein